MTMRAFADEPVAHARHAGSGRRSGSGAPEAVRRTSVLQAVADGSARVARQGQLCEIVNGSARVRAQAQLGQLVANGRHTAAEPERQDGKEDPATQAGREQRPGALPPSLRSGIFQLSGIDLGKATVHRNSAAPGRIRAHAYAGGGQIHLGPGQERHLPHEAWHLVQQAQGRVRPTMQAKGMALNTDDALEKEADRMGARAAAMGRAGGSAMAEPWGAPQSAPGPMQAFWMRQDGKPEWINEARKVDALLTPEADPAPAGPAAEGGFANSYGGSTIYRQSALLQVPWTEVARLITLLGAAKVQAIYVRQFPLWGTAAGLAAIEAQLAPLARLDLTVLQALFANSAATVSHLLTTASQSDFTRIFSGKREQQLALAIGGALGDIVLPLPAAEAEPPASAPAVQEPAAGAVALDTGDRREAIRSAVAEQVAGRQRAGRAPGQLLDSLAQQWGADMIAGQIARADADRGRGATVLDSLALPGAGPGGIFAGVRARVRDAITEGPYQAEDAVVKARSGSAVVQGDYTDADGTRHPHAVHGRFEGTLSGIGEGQAQAVGAMLAKGAGTVSARLDGRALAGGRLAGSITGQFAMPGAFVDIRSEQAHFEGTGQLSSRMDGPVHTADTGAGATGRQIIADGAHNRAVLASSETGTAEPGEAVTALMQGSTQGFGHPVGNAGRYSNLTMKLAAAKQRTAGIFEPDTLHQIVHHAGAAGTTRQYRQRGDVAGPALLDGRLLADRLTIEGQLGHLVANDLLSMPMARMAQLRLAVDAPQLKPATAAPDIALASAPKAGASYSTTVERKKYEFKLEALKLPSHWSGAGFRYRYRLEYKTDAHYVPDN